jgi:hypothetical protein
MMASSEDSMMAARRSSVRRRSVTSTSMLTAPIRAPVSSRSGLGKGLKRTRLPSGRSAIASMPVTARFSLMAIAIGHSSCAIGVPSSR